MRSFQQFVYDQVRHPNYSIPFGRWRTRVFKALFGVIRRWRDPLVIDSIGGTRMFLPYSHELPVILKYNRFYASNVVRIAKRVSEKYPEMTVIDVGANIGDTAAFLRGELDNPILCVEGDPGYFEILSCNADSLPDVESVRVCLGDREGGVAARFVQTGGTGRLAAAADGSAEIRTETLSGLAARHPRFADAKLVKVDTDGYDVKVLRGGLEWFRESRPVLFFEYDPDLLRDPEDSGLRVFKMCQSVGYSHGLFYDNTGRLLLSTELRQSRALRQLRSAFCGGNDGRYMDVCLFHSVDRDLFEAIAEAETVHFERATRPA